MSEREKGLLWPALPLPAATQAQPAVACMTQAGGPLRRTGPRRTRAPADGQRSAYDPLGVARLVPTGRHQDHVHRAWFAVGKPVHRVVQQRGPGRAVQRRGVRHAARGPARCRSVAAGVQRLQAALLPRGPRPSGVRGHLDQHHPTSILTAVGPHQRVPSRWPGIGWALISASVMALWEFPSLATLVLLRGTDVHPEEGPTTALALAATVRTKRIADARATHRTAAALCAGTGSERRPQRRSAGQREARASTCPATSRTRRRGGRRTSPIALPARATNSSWGALQNQDDGSVASE